MNNYLTLIISIIIAFVAIFAVIFVAFGWNGVKQTLLFLMLQAKRMAKDAILSNGQAQEDWIVNKALLVLLPKQMFIIQFISRILGKTPEVIIRQTIHILWKKLQDYVDDGKINNSVK